MQRSFHKPRTAKDVHRMGAGVDKGWGPVFDAYASSPDLTTTICDGLRPRIPITPPRVSSTPGTGEKVRPTPSGGLERRPGR